MYFMSSSVSANVVVVVVSNGGSNSDATHSSILDFFSSFLSFFPSCICGVVVKLSGVGSHVISLTHSLKLFLIFPSFLHSFLQCCGETMIVTVVCGFLSLAHSLSNFNFPFFFLFLSFVVIW